MIVLILFLLTIKSNAAPGHYECGVHGRFEYCIDDFPGCVIGCHCYPGYYFDTESKICEPNTKLTQDYRRHMQPTAYNLHGSSGALMAPALPPPQEVAASTDEPAQEGNTGDLSDWLYNQFFKTIESQVVNKTDEEPLKAGTRRSGGGAPIEPFPTRRHKNNRRRKSRKRSSRKKIIRIDDDDSDEGSSSGSSSSDSTSDDSKGDLGSWERFEWNPRPSPNAPPEAKDGAHRQIVMYSKKPKPPLPSFIFLPNMGTAFYPPIGLPAPAIPMYPMVPIPPINPGQPENGENETEKTTQAASTQEPTTSVPTTTVTATTAAPQATTAPSSLAPDVKPDQEKALRSHNFYNKFHPRNRNKPQHRQVFKPSPLPPPMDYPMKQYHQDSDYDAMFMGDTNLLLGQGDKMDAMDSGPNFKYISELIHRDHNDSTTQSSTIRNPMKYEQFFGMKPPMPHENKKRHPITPGRLDSTRRRFDPRKNGEDDSYYSSLGKQIAKLIRGLDAEGVREANFNIGPAKDPKPEHPFFSESSYAARTYWERFVRSPLSLRLKNFTKYEDLIASNENLFEVENQVQEATPAPVLSLLELENVINTMGTIRKQHDRALKDNYNKISNASLNVNLLPRFTARRSLVSQNPDIKNKNNTLNAAFDDVIEKLARSSRKKKPGKKVFKEELNEHSKNASKNGLANNLTGSIYFNTNIHKLRSFVSTLKPMFLTSIVKSKQHDVGHNNNNKIVFFNEIVNKPRVISVGGETTFLKSKKYFFDSGTNYQYQSWAMD